MSPDSVSHDAAAAGAVTPFVRSLRMYIRAGYPILYLVSAEEDRAIELVSAALQDGELSRRKPYVWSVSRGLCTVDLKPIDRRTADPKRILPYLLEMKEPGVFMLEDFHFFTDERSPVAAVAVRQLRDLVGPFKAERKTAIILSPVLKIPPELEKDITVIDLDLPTEEELLGVLEETIEQVKDNPRVEADLEQGARELIVKALSGLTRSEAENALAKIIVTNSRIDPEDIDLILAEKE